MMSLVEGLPGNVVGVSAHGQITQRDYEAVFIPALEAALAKHGKVRVYYEIGDFAGVDFGAAMADLRIGFGRLMHWERIAVVTDVPWMRHAAEFFGHLMTAQTRAFAMAQAAEAKAWIAS